MEHESPSPSPVRIIIIGLIGIAFLIAAASTAMKTIDFLESAEVTPGVVSRLTAGGSHPEIRFTTLSGQQYEFPQGGFIFGYEKGMAVDVYYLPEDPGRTAVIKDPGAIWVIPATFGVFSIFALTHAVLGIRRRRKECGK
ncbi:Protein of unknown function [Pseudomonas delhiensis]|uniref:DUF3592 domain-containing protein n=1 Tax=Pseudomonas delhiensis TaxID=366289 RepID=A0A239JQU4_9PSED|nr:DUF3592 domain-containing protein [Pseudomonas delhiensis]SDK06652.1 Protein of unknown function [Pseudomonas delhiensis]SNT08119.1 Protein of unknown function [Pseudomonas delhiensis]